jgi:hypothetical protein
MMTAMLTVEAVRALAAWQFARIVASSSSAVCCLLFERVQPMHVT